MPERNSGSSAVAFERLSGSSGVVLVCEHASNRFPGQFGDLGLDDSTRESHAAWDIGAHDLALEMSRQLDAPLVSSTVSRLVYDCNRLPESDTAIVTRSERFEIPGNIDLTQQQRNERVEQVYLPFRSALADLLDRRQQDGLLTAMVTIHSFTAVYYGKPREVEIGVLHDEDSRLADAVLTDTTGAVSYRILRNEPYGPDDDVMHTLKYHALPRAIPNIMLEIRNDLLRDAGSVLAVADLLCARIDRALQDIIAS